MLERLVLLVGFGLEHLILELRDLLLLDLDVAFVFLTFFLVGGERAAIGVELALVGFQLLFDFGDVLRQGSNFLG